MMRDLLFLAVGMTVLVGGCGHESPPSSAEADTVTSTITAPPESESPAPSSEPVGQASPESDYRFDTPIETVRSVLRAHRMQDIETLVLAHDFQTMARLRLSQIMPLEAITEDVIEDTAGQMMQGYVSTLRGGGFESMLGVRVRVISATPDPTVPQIVVVDQVWTLPDGTERPVRHLLRETPDGFRVVGKQG